MQSKTILRLSVLLLVGILLLSLSACDLFSPAESDTTDTTPATTPAVTEPGSVTEPATEPGTDPTPEPSVVRVVYIGADGYQGATSFDAAAGLVLGTPERTGYDFAGWYLTEDFSGSPVTRIPGGETGTDGTVTLWAKWEVLTLTVNLDSGIPGAAVTRRKLAFGESLTLAAPDAAYPGYAFTGWKHGTADIATGSSFTYDDPDLTSVTFVGQWKTESYRVRYMVDGTEYASETLAFGTAITKTAAAEGRSFLGWSTDAAATEPMTGLTVGAGDMTLYAVFEAEQHKVAVVVPAGLTVPGLTSGSYAHGTRLTLPASITGYSLSYVAVDAEGRQQAVTSGSWIVNGDVTIRVTAKAVKLTLTLAGEWQGAGTIRVDYGSLLTSVLDGKTSDGKTVIGWFYDAEMTKPVLVGDRLTSVSDLTFWAKTGDAKSVTFHFANGEARTLTFAFGAALTETDSKAGHTFRGWADANGNAVDAMASAEMELYPVFTINSYRLSFDLAGGTGDIPGTITAEYGSTVTLPDGSELLKNYREFGGWLYQGKVYASAAEITVGEGDVTLTAIWNKIAITVTFYDWDDTVIYEISTYAGDTFRIAGTSVIESVKEFDRWQFTDTLGAVCVFRNGETVLSESTAMRAIYCKKVWNSEKGAYEKTDLVYPSPKSLYFEPNSYDKDGNPTRYYVSGHVVEDGKISDAYIAILPYDLCIPSTYHGGLVNGLVKGTASTRGAFCTYVNSQVNAIRFRSIFIPSAIHSIPDYAFYGQYCDVTFGLDSEVTFVGLNGFCCELLGSSAGVRNFYNFPTKLSQVGNYAFGINLANANAPWSWYLQDGTRINELPETIVYIGRRAFTNVALFEKVYFGKNLKGIGVGAFNGMRSLTEITIDPSCPLSAIPEECFRNTGLCAVEIPAAVVTIGASAFQDCTSLVSVKFAENAKLKTIGDYAFYGYDAALPYTELILPEGLETIGKGAFSWHNGGPNSGAISGNFSYGSWHQVVAKKAVGTLTKLVLPSTLKEIGVCAFAYQNLTELTLPASLVTIGDGAFYSCYGILTVDLTGLTNLKTIGRAAFMRFYDPSVTQTFTLTIPENVETVGPYAFVGMSNLTKIVFAGTSLKEIGEGAFGDTGLKSYELVLPEGLVKIGNRAFYYTELVSVHFPKTVEEIGWQAFGYSATLKTVTFDENPDSENGLVIGNDAFGHCTALETLVLPCQLTRVTGNWGFSDYNGAFSYCTALKRVTFNGRGDGQADRELGINTSAFYGCSALTEVHIKRNVRISFVFGDGESNVSNVMFYGCPATLKIYVLSSMRVDYANDNTGWGGVFTSGRATLETESE